MDMTYLGIWLICNDHTSRLSRIFSNSEVFGEFDDPSLEIKHGPKNQWIELTNIVCS